MARNDIERARKALRFIPPDLPRDKWHTVGRALISAGMTIDDIDEWSSPASNYRGYKDVASAFRTITPEGGTGLGTLLKIAAENGYEPNGKPMQRPAQAPRKAAEPPHKSAPGMIAAEVWSRCEAATEAHDYVVSKNGQGVPLEGLRVVPADDSLYFAGQRLAGALVVPVYGSQGLLSLVFIPASGAGKLNLPGPQMAGGYFIVGKLKSGGIAYLCEGIGTAWACWQATGDAAVVCFGAGNMGKVANTLRQQDADARLVLVPDVGQESKAEKIAADVGAAIAFMPLGEANNFDANDLAQRDGGDVLKLLLEQVAETTLSPPMLKPVSVFDVLTNPAPPPQFVWDGYLPRGVVSLLGAHGGTGKSTIALMLSVCAGLGRPLFGVDTVQCKTLFVSLEDSAHIVRHRLAFICHTWGINPALLDGKLLIVDGTENPELFSADSREAGQTTATYFELRKLVQSEGVGLVVVDNASDAYGGDEIQRKQVRAFIRSLVMVARLTDCAVVLLAHVDKNTSRNKRADGGEGYSGSTAWHNSARSRLFMTCTDNGTLTLEHQKSNLGKKREVLELEWRDDGLPQLTGNDPADNPLDPLMPRIEGRADDERAISLLRMIAEFESRQQYCSPAITSRNHVHAVLKSEPIFLKLKLRPDDTKRIVNQCQRAKWLEPMNYRTPDRKPHQRWTVTHEGRLIAGLIAPTAPTVPTTEDGASLHMAQASAPTAPTGVGGVGERVHTQDGAKPIS